MVGKRKQHGELQKSTEQSFVYSHWTGTGVGLPAYLSSTLKHFSNSVIRRKKKSIRDVRRSWASLAASLY